VRALVQIEPVQALPHSVVQQPRLNAVLADYTLCHVLVHHLKPWRDRDAAQALRAGIRDFCALFPKYQSTAGTPPEGQIRR
jgi:hypothetical protein